MRKTLTAILLCTFLLIMVVSVWADSAKEKQAPYAQFLADVSSDIGPPVENIYLQWGLDQVTWTQVGSAITPFIRAASGHIGNYVYCFGEQNSNVGQAYNITTQSWQASTPPLLGNCNWCGVTANENIYIVGRYDGSYGNEVQKFTPTGAGPTGTWQFVAPYPLTECAITADWDGGSYIYAAGGSSSNPAAYRYDIAANTWEAIASMPAAMRYAGGAFCQGKFYVMGGTQTGMANTNYEYDPVTNTWATRAPIPIAVHFGLFSFTYNQTYVLSIGGGGGYGSWPATNAIQIYDPATNAWTQETTLPQALGCNTGVWIGGAGEVVSAGGYDGLNYHTETYLGTNFPGGAEPLAPAAPSNFVVLDNGATLLASLSWTNPTTTVNGTPLTTIDSVVVLRNDEQVWFSTTGTPGQAMTWDDNTMTSAGMYSYAVYCVNSVGPGVMANASAWIGPDVPHDVNNLVLTPAPNYELEATLTWVNPTSGAHGGYYPGITGYTILRDSDEGHTGTFDLPGEHTTFVDSDVPDPDYYWYTVIPYNGSGEGMTAVSNTAWIGFPEIWVWDTTTYQWNDISSVGTNAGLTGDDQNVGPFPIGFDFEFYGGDIFNTIRFCSNGFQSFTSTSTDFSNDPIPTAAEPNNLIASFWEDLNCSSGGVVHYYHDAGAGTFTVQYTNVPYYSGGGTVTFQMVLDEMAGTITCYYNTIGGINTSCTVGIENSDGTDGVQVCYNGSGTFLPASQTAIRFIPPSPPLSGTLEGYVYENAAPQDPLENAMVVVLADTGYTDATGFYHIEQVYTGEHNARAMYFGYNTVTEAVTIALDSTTTQDFYLPQPIMTVDVTSIDVALPVSTPHDEEFNIANVGDGTLDFDITIVGGGTWVLADPMHGTVGPSESELITVSFLMPDTGNIGDVYNADLIIDNNTITPEVLIPIEVIIISAVPGSEEFIPTDYALYQNYPNPFNPTTQIRFDLREQSHVVLEVFNVLGQKVVSLIDGDMSAGRYTVEFNASKMSSGFYFYRISANDFTDMKKMILMR